MTLACDSKFHAYAIIRHTFDYWSKKNKKRYTGYSLLSESHSIFPLGYKYLETLAERCIDQKQKQNALLK